MQKQKIKLLKKIMEKGKILFLGKTDLEALEFFSEKNLVVFVLTKLNQKNLVEKTIQNKNLVVLLVNSFKEIKEEFDFSVVFHEDFLGTEKTIKLLEIAGEKTQKKGKIYFIGKTSRGAKKTAEEMNQIFGNAKTVSVKGGLRLIVSEKTKKIIPKKESEKVFDFSFRNNFYSFNSSSGVFSKNKIDDGTKFLLENLEKIKEKKVLDFGCGIGVIGIILAKENPLTKVLMIDSDLTSVELTKKNAGLNKVNNVKVLVSDGFQNIKEKFDLIASNPPTHEKREFLEKFVLDSKKFLEKNGRIVLVLNKAVFLEKELKEVFGNCEILAEGKEHKVLEAKSN